MPSINALEAGRNLITVPQLYGTTYTLFAHILPKMGIGVRFAKSDRAADFEALIDDDTRAIFCETVGNPAGNVCDLEALATVAHRHRMPLIVDNTVATPMLVRPVEYGADIVIHSLTKFMGGHGTTPGRHHRRLRALSLDDSRGSLSHVHAAGRVLSRLGLYRSLRRRGFHRPLPQRMPAHHGGRALADERLPAVAGHRDGGAARRSSRRECAQGRRVPARRRARRIGELCRVCRQSLSRPGAKISGRQGLFADDFRNSRRPAGGHAFLQRAETVQAIGQFGRREIARLPSGIDDASANVRRRTIGRGCRTRQYSLERRHRTHRRHSRRSGSSPRRRGLKSAGLAGRGSGVISRSCGPRADRATG